MVLLIQSYVIHIPERGYSWKRHQPHFALRRYFEPHFDLKSQYEHPGMIPQMISLIPIFKNTKILKNEANILLFSRNFYSFKIHLDKFSIHQYARNNMSYRLQPLVNKIVHCYCLECNLVRNMGFEFGQGPLMFTSITRY